VGAIVGEEDETCAVNLASRPYSVGDILVPEVFYGQIEDILVSIDRLSSQVGVLLLSYYHHCTETCHR